MTAKELIEELKKFPENYIIYLYDHDSEGYIYSEEAQYVDDFGDDGIIIN